MMRRQVAMALVLAAGAAVAADSADSARRCAEVGDSLQRLMCYDRLFPPGAAGVAPAIAPPAAVPVPPVASAQAAPAPAPAPAASAPAFGEEMLAKSVDEVKAKSGPRTLNATVQALRETRRNVYVVTLDNGQTWQQMDADSQFYVKVGDSVQIDRGSMGGYRMARTSDGRSGWVRVNRVK